MKRLIFTLMLIFLAVSATGCIYLDMVPDDPVRKFEENFWRDGTSGNASTEGEEAENELPPAESDPNDLGG